MKAQKGFVLVKELALKEVNGSFVSEDFDIEEIKKSLGDVEVDVQASHVKNEGYKVFLVLVFYKIKRTDPALLRQAASILH